MVDLEAFQASNRLPSNPYDVVSDGGKGWYISDGAANNILHVDQAGTVTIVAYFPNLAASGLGGRQAEGVPAGPGGAGNATSTTGSWSPRTAAR
jgi:hypothetical protein